MVGLFMFLETTIQTLCLSCNSKSTQEATKVARDFHTVT